MKNFLAQYTAPYRFYNSTRNLLLKLKYPKLLIGRYTIVQNSSFETNASLGNYVSLCNSKLGNHTYVSGYSQINNTVFGRFCSVGPGVKTGMGIHPASEFISTHPAFYSLRRQSGSTFVSSQKFKEEQPVEIGHDVWIGANAIIADGVKIGNGAIIAAGAVVIKNVAPFEIVGGVPAKHIRFRFSSEEIEKIQQLAWWNKDEKWLKENAAGFLDKSAFLSRVPA